jgi:hypothetical protein
MKMLPSSAYRRFCALAARGDQQLFDRTNLCHAAGAAGAVGFLSFAGDQQLAEEGCC